MSDHQMESEGPWPTGWLWSVVAALVAAMAARWLGGVSIQAAVLSAVMVFVVYSVLLAQFWEAPVSADHDDGDEDHGFDAHASHDH